MTIVNGGEILPGGEPQSFGRSSNGCVRILRVGRDVSRAASSRGGSGQARLAELDLLRFLAALAVLAFHYLVAFASIWGERPSRLFPATAPVAGLGVLGVELFFMISGFVILMTAWGRGLGGFARSRFVRLYPAYWLSVGAVAAVYGLTEASALDPRLSPGEYAVNLTMIQRAFEVGDANGVYWSLWVELRFYALMSILVLAGVTLTRCLIFMGVWLAATLAAVLVPAPGLEPLIDLVVMPKYAPYFIAGMALYLIHRFGSSVLLWIFVVAGYALALRSALSRVRSRVELAGKTAMPVEDWMVVVTITVIFLLMAAVALGALRWLRAPGLTTLGGLTYPLYLFHTPVAVLLIPALHGALSPWGAVAVTTLAAIALSYVVYRFAEQPIQRLLRPRRAGTRRRTRGAASMAAARRGGPGVPV